MAWFERSRFDMRGLKTTFEPAKRATMQSAVNLAYQTIGRRRCGGGFFLPCAKNGRPLATPEAAGVAYLDEGRHGSRHAGAL